MIIIQEQEGKEARSLREAKRRKMEQTMQTMRRKKLKEEDPQAYAEMLRKMRERQSIKYKIKFDEPQPCPHCAKMFEYKYAMQVSVGPMN